MSPDKISEYPNAQLTFPRPFVGRILAGGAAMAVPAAAASGAAASEGSAKARVADHISQAVQSTSNLLHLMQQSSPSQVRLFSFGSSPIFVWFEVLWVLVRGEVVGGSVSWKRINFFLFFLHTRLCILWIWFNIMSRTEVSNIMYVGLSNLWVYFNIMSWN